MTTVLLRLPVNRLRRLSSGGGTALIVLPGAAVLGGVAALHPELWRGLLAAALIINLIVLGMKWPRAAAVATLLWLPFLGLTRRLLISEAGWVQNDPLILVGPVVALFLCYRLFVIEKRRLVSDRISQLVLLLLILAVVQVFNPFGVGGISGGLAGVIYLGVPLLWFFIGRELGDRVTVTRLIYALAILAVGIACYGLYQTEWGSFPSWDLDWYHTSGFAALGAGRTEGGVLQLRPWATFPSNSEYSAFLGIAVVFAAAMLLHRRLLLAVTVPLLTVGVFLAGGRSIMALMILTVMVLTAMRTRNRVLALGVVILGVATAYGAAAAFGDRVDRAASLSGDAKAEGQAGGLLNPLDPDESTFLGHWDNLKNGVVAGFENPVGQGTAASNIGARAGGGGGVETDNDIADVFVSYGFVGGIAFVILIVLCFRTVFSRYSRGPPDPLLMAVAGVMVVTLGYWLNGGHYFTSALVWFLIGWAVRPLPEEQQAGAKSKVGQVVSRWGEWGPVRRLRGEAA